MAELRHVPLAALAERYTTFYGLGKAGPVKHVFVLTFDYTARRDRLTHVSFTAC
jgi:hypothetical protein